jgi:hypothetical protein
VALSSLRGTIVVPSAVVQGACAGVVEKQVSARAAILASSPSCPMLIVRVAWASLTLGATASPSQALGAGGVAARPSSARLVALVLPLLGFGTLSLANLFPITTNAFPTSSPVPWMDAVRVPAGPVRVRVTSMRAFEMVAAILRPRPDWPTRVSGMDTVQSSRSGRFVGSRPWGRVAPSSDDAAWQVGDVARGDVAVAVRDVAHDSRLWSLCARVSTLRESSRSSRVVSVE